MKTFRKALSIILGLAIMLSCVAGMQVSVAAEGTLALKVGEATIENDVVTVPVVVEEGNPGFQALGVTVGYDANVLKLEEVVKNVNFSDAQNYLPADGKLTDNGAIGNPEKNPITIMWSYSLVDADITATGTIATLTFSVVNDDYVGTTDIDLTVTQAYNVAEEDLLPNTTATDGVVTFPCKHANKTTTTVKATCLAAGSTTVTCADCGETLSTQEIPKMEHDYTYTNNGDTHSAICPNGCEGIASEDHTYVDGFCVCGAEEETECTEHTAGNWVMTTAPDPVSDGGVQKKFCTVCGAELETRAGDPNNPAKGIRAPRFYNMTLNLQDKIVVNYMVRSTDTTNFGYDNYKIVFKLNNPETNTEAEYTVDESYLKNSYYYFDFDKVIPNQFGDIITATIYGQIPGDETWYEGRTVTYSVKQYCESVFTTYGTANQKLSTLCVDILNYGAATQVYTNYKTDALVNADLTDAQKAWASPVNERTSYQNIMATHNITSTPATAPAAWKNAGLYLESAINYDLIFGKSKSATEEITDLTGYSVRVSTSEGVLIDEVFYDENPDAFRPYTTGQYTFRCDSLNPSQIRDTIYFEILKDGVVVSKALTYHAESYAAAARDAALDEKLLSLMDAMMSYADGTKNFVS